MYGDDFDWETLLALMNIAVKLIPKKRYYETLRRQKIRIGTQDLRIAAIVLAVKGILVTRNWKDFAKVPDLTLEDWSIP